MIENNTRTIDGIVFVVTQLPAIKALHVFHRLGKVVSPSLAKASAALQPGAALEKVNLADLGGALESFFSSCTPADLDYFVKELLYATTADGAPLLQVLDVKLQGKVLTLLKLLVFAVEVNYADFFGPVRGLVARAQAITNTSSISKAVSLKKS